MLVESLGVATPLTLAVDWPIHNSMVLLPSLTVTFCVFWSQPTLAPIGVAAYPIGSVASSSAKWADKLHPQAPVAVSVLYSFASSISRLGTILSPGLQNRSLFMVARFQLEPFHDQTPLLVAT